MPDFLQLEHDDTEMLLLGQDELPQAVVEEDVEDACASWLESRPDLDRYVTERLLVATARVGQHRFAQGVLRNHEHRCVFCSLSITSGG